MASFSVRPYRPADRDQVLALASRLTEGVAAWRDPDAVRAAARGWVEGSIETSAEPGHAVYVAADGDDVAGVVAVSERSHFTGQRDAYVGELAVRAGLERQGIASRLMAAAEGWAGDRGLAFLTLETGAANETARRFYQALGYQEEDVRLTRAVPVPGPE